MNKIRVITDSASDITTWDSDMLTILPMSIRFGQEEYLDGVTIRHKEFYEKLIENDSLPTTSLISPNTFSEAFEEAVSRGEQVLVITISSKLSGTYQSAVIAAGDFPNQVYVVDSLNVAVGERNLISYAFELIEKGMPIEEIAATLDAVKEKIHTIALLDTLEYLKKGGRISKTVAFVGGALSIKPVVSVVDGEVVFLGKARGSRSGSNYLVSEIEKASGIDFSMPFCLGYTGLSDALLQKYIEDSQELWANYTDNLPIASVGATVGTHVGPGAIVVSFFANEKK